MNSKEILPIFFYISETGGTLSMLCWGHWTTPDASGFAHHLTWHQDLIIMNWRSEDLVFSPNSTVWPQANSSFLSLSFLICATMGSTERMLKNFVVLRRDDHDIDDKEDDAHETQVHSDWLNGKLGGSKAPPRKCLLQTASAPAVCMRRGSPPRPAVKSQRRA